MPQFSFLGFVAVLTSTVSEFMTAFAKVDWILYLGGVIAFLGPCATTTARANITKLVSPFEIGATFAVVGAFQVTQRPDLTWLLWNPLRGRAIGMTLAKPGKCVLCMYVCMYRGRPSWNCPWEGAIQLSQEEGPIGIMGPMSRPLGYHWSHVTHACMYSHTIVCFPYQLYSRQLRVTCILIYRGAVSHRARVGSVYEVNLGWIFKKLEAHFFAESLLARTSSMGPVCHYTSYMR